MAAENKTPFSLAGAKNLYADLTGKSSTATSSDANVACSVAGAKKLYAELSGKTDTSVPEDAEVAFSVAGAKALAAELTPVLKPDSFTVTQWEDLIVLNNQLTNNDYLGTGNSVKSIAFHDAVKGQLSNTSTQVTFKSTGFASEPAGFKYTITDKRGRKTTASVSVSVSPLPEMDAYIFTTGELALWMKNFVPPSQREVFDSWHRFSGLNDYFPSGTTPTGEASKWEMVTDDKFRSMVNSTYPIGLISPKAYDNYTFEAVLSVEDDDQTFKDDDQIGFILGFMRKDNINSYLALIRAANPSWKADGTLNPTQAFRVTNFRYDPTTDKFIQPILGYCPDKTIIVPNKVAPATTPAWNTLQPTKIKVVRTPTGITCSCSPWGSTDLAAGGSFQLDFASSRELSYMTEPMPYGFYASSQYGATWSEVDFNGGDTNAKEAYDFESNSVWEYKNAAWQKTTKNIQTALGYPRVVKSVTTGERYQITKNAITKL